MSPAKLDAANGCLRRRPILRTYKILSCLLVAFSAGSAVRAQQPVLETPQQTNERIRSFSAAAQQIHRDYVIGPGDLLSVEVFDVAELTRTTRVSQTGTIALPLIPVRLHVAGLTEIQTEQKLSEVLQANGLVTRPQVSVSVREKKSKPITIVGAVVHPMVYQAERQVTRLEVISEAGGIANDAGNVVIVTRPPPDPRADSAMPDLPEVDKSPALQDPPAGHPMPKPISTGPAVEGAPTMGTPGDAQHPTPTTQDPPASEEPLPPTVITIGLNDLLEGGSTKNNLVLEAGDVVTVPHAGIVYVIGAVERPGGFVLSNDRSQMSTLKVLSLAGGLRHTAKASSAVILRKDSSGQQQQVAVDLKKVLARQTEDVTLIASDILFVPESGGKRAMIKAAEVALAIGTAAAIFRLAQ
jgi:protein involved in polysaccharide export with SLBB domain